MSLKVSWYRIYPYNPRRSFNALYEDSSQGLYCIVWSLLFVGCIRWYGGSCLQTNIQIWRSLGHGHGQACYSAQFFINQTDRTDTLCRCTTACLLCFLSSAYPDYATVFQFLITLDFSSHYMHMYRSGSPSASNQQWTGLFTALS